jgi:phosphoglycerate dehydrogenase-like enzyme
LSSETHRPLRVVIPPLPAGVSAGEWWPVNVDVEWIETPYVDNKPNPSVLANADVYIGTDFTQEMGAAATSLKAILIAAAGYDRIDPAAVPQGVVVANAYHHEAPIAEWVMSVAVALDHELFKSERTFRSGDWSQWPSRFGSYRELYGRTFGIIGYGAIGKRVARLAHAYDMKVIAAGRRAETTEEARGDNVEYGAGQEAMDRVLKESDFVLVSTPLIDATRGLIGEREIGLMRDDAYLINPARGHIVDEKALYDAVSSRSIAGAAIDVWYEYPVASEDAPRPSKYPFWELDNVIMTPHHSGATFGTFTRRAKTVAANIDRLSRGEQLENVLNDISTI